VGRQAAHKMRLGGSAAVRIYFRCSAVNRAFHAVTNRYLAVDWPEPKDSHPTTRMSIFAFTAIALIIAVTQWSGAPTTKAAHAAQGLSVNEMQANAGALPEAEDSDRSFVFE
jgi:hypothetical protein